MDRAASDAAVPTLIGNQSQRVRGRQNPILGG